MNRTNIGRIASAAIATLCAFAALAPMTAFAKGSRSGGSHAHYSYGGGRYAGGHGSSHKNGKYKNPATGDHYRHH